MFMAGTRSLTCEIEQWTGTLRYVILLIITKCSDSGHHTVILKGWEVDRRSEVRLSVLHTDE